MPPHPKSRPRSIVRRLATQLSARHFPHRMPPIRSSSPCPACSLVETTRTICSDPGPPLFSGRILGVARVQRPEEFLGETEARRRALFSGGNGAASGPILGGAIGWRRVRFTWSRTRHPDLERSLRPSRAVGTADPALAWPLVLLDSTEHMKHYSRMARKMADRKLPSPNQCLASLKIYTSSK